MTGVKAVIERGLELESSICAKADVSVRAKARAPGTSCTWENLSPSAPNLTVVSRVPYRYRTVRVGPSRMLEMALDYDKDRHLAYGMNSAGSPGKRDRKVGRKTGNISFPFDLSDGNDVRFQLPIHIAFLLELLPSSL